MGQARVIQREKGGMEIRGTGNRDTGKRVCKILGREGGETCGVDWITGEMKDVVRLKERR